MILYTHNNKLVKIRSGLNAGKLIEKYVAPPPPSFDEVTIGTQTWMAKNLSIDDGQGGISTQTVNYGHGDVVEYYYTWNAAARVADSINGWHIPSKEEWETLLSTVGYSYTKLKSTYGWDGGYNGNDQYGFGIFPAGLGGDNVGILAFLWTSTLYNQGNAYCIRFYQNRSDMTTGAFSNRMSVRLIKDQP